MIRIYSENDLKSVQTLRKNLIKKAIILGAVCLILNVIVIILKFGVPWGESTFWYQFANCVISIVYGVWLVYFFGVPYKLTRQYLLLYKSLVNANVVAEKNILLGIRKQPIDRDGLLFYEFVFYPGVDAKGNEKITKVYLEAERAIPDIKPGDEILVQSSSGILVGYEVLTRGAIDREQLDEILDRLSKKLDVVTADFKE